VSSNCISVEGLRGYWGRKGSCGYIFVHLNPQRREAHCPLSEKLRRVIQLHPGELQRTVPRQFLLLSIVSWLLYTQDLTDIERMVRLHLFAEAESRWHIAYNLRLLRRTDRVTENWPRSHGVELRVLQRVLRCARCDS
jgi:hypothetical protein